MAEGREGGGPPKKFGPKNPPETKPLGHKIEGDDPTVAENPNIVTREGTFKDTAALEALADELAAGGDPDDADLDAQAARRKTEILDALPQTPDRDVTMDDLRKGWKVMGTDKTRPNPTLAIDAEGLKRHMEMEQQKKAAAVGRQAGVFPTIPKEQPAYPEEGDFDPEFVARMASEPDDKTMMVDLKQARDNMRVERDKPSVIVDTDAKAEADLYEDKETAAIRKAIEPTQAMERVPRYDEEEEGMFEIEKDGTLKQISGKTAGDGDKEPGNPDAALKRLGRWVKGLFQKKS